MSKNQKQKNQSMSDNSQDSAKSKHGFNQSGNSGMQPGIKDTKGKR